MARSIGRCIPAAPIHSSMELSKKVPLGESNVYGFCSAAITIIILFGRVSRLPEPPAVVATQTEEAAPETPVRTSESDTEDATPHSGPKELAD